jgi:polar amino acid transport system permease protein
MFLVVLPQAWRTILPPVGNEFIALLKDSPWSPSSPWPTSCAGPGIPSVSFNYFEAYNHGRPGESRHHPAALQGVSAMENRLNYYDHRN